jgi:thiamine-monophosphate kinase
MDVSDGLAGDLGKLCRASGVGATVDVAWVPLSDAALTALVADERATQTILTGGDDFEVVATVPQRSLASFYAAARKARVRVTDIGRVTTGHGARFRTPDGRVLRFVRASFSHF